MPWSRALAQLPTPMMATRTLPLESAIGASVVQLLADVQDALQNRDPGRDGKHDDRPLEPSPRGEDEAGRDDDHALRAGAEANVPAEAERLGLRPCIRHEEGARDRGDRED